MSKFTWSHISLNAVSAPVASEEFDFNGFSNCLFSVDLSEQPTAGTAQVVFEYKNAAGVWRTLYQQDITVDTPQYPDVVHLQNLPAKRVRCRVAAYDNLEGASGAVTITVCVDIN